jgi:PiT family inorganic phosphate transporter
VRGLLVLQLLVAALLFAAITGANDGASIVATNLQSKAVRPMTSILMLTASVIVVPLIFGTSVATTFAHGLVTFEGREGASALLIAVLVTVFVIFVFNRSRVPTSVTQALVGAIVGAGVGRQLPIAWGMVAGVLCMNILAPSLSLVLARVVAIVVVRIAPHHQARSRIRALHALSYGLQCLAYSTNDAQKMIAIMSVATGSLAISHAAIAAPGTQMLIGGLYLVGTLFGLRGLAGRLGQQLIPVRPLNSVVAGYASAATVVGSAILGLPVSMPQSSAAALVGSDLVLETRSRVRWNEAARIGLVWLTTFPTAAGLAVIVGILTR